MPDDLSESVVCFLQGMALVARHIAVTWASAVGGGVALNLNSDAYNLNLESKQVSAIMEGPWSSVWPTCPRLSEQWHY